MPLLVVGLALVGLVVGVGALAAPWRLALFGAGYVNASVEPFRLLLVRPGPRRWPG